MPILLFIHGGGFYLGSNWYPQLDFGRLVRLSRQCGMPTIAVSIKYVQVENTFSALAKSNSYRLGAPGLLYSNEMRSLGCQSNNALRDQRIALQWVKRNIQGFGGDPDNITVIGQSVGGCTSHSFCYQLSLPCMCVDIPAVSSAILLCSDEPLCRRIISLGGSIPLLRPVSLKQADAIYDSVIKHFGFTGLSPSKRLEALIKLPAQDLLESLPTSIRLSPVIDSDIIPSEPTFESIADGSFSMPGETWCENILVGYTKLDVSLVLFLLGRTNEY